MTAAIPKRCSIKLEITWAGMVPVAEAVIWESVSRNRLLLWIYLRTAVILFISTYGVG